MSKDLVPQNSASASDCSMEEKHIDTANEGEITTINSSFFNRVFSWKKVNAQYENVFAKLQTQIGDLETVNKTTHDKLFDEIEENKQQIEKYDELKNDYNTNLLKLSEVEKDFAVLKEKYESLMADNNRLVLKIEEVEKKQLAEQVHTVKLTADYSKLHSDYSGKVSEVTRLEKQVAVDAEHTSSLEGQISYLTEKLTAMETKNENLNAANSDLSLKLYEGEKNLLSEQERTTVLSAERDALSAEKSELAGRLSEKEADCLAVSASLKELQQKMADDEGQTLKSWEGHVEFVADELKNIAQKYDYIKVDSRDYQYAGSPQNVFLFCKQFTIFDAISPENLEDLPEFPKHVRDYTEDMKKYFKTENLRMDAFLVVPTTTLSALDTFTFHYPTYTVHVIPPEAMLSILRMLKELEVYDFAHQIAEEGKDKICKLLARLSVTAKKKVEFDSYYTKELVSTLKDIKSLPSQYTQKILNYQKYDKLLSLDTVPDVTPESAGFADDTNKN